MTEFEQRIKLAAEQSVLKAISEGTWLMPNHEHRMRIPVEWMIECWRLVDVDKIRQQVAARIESELADRMVNSMAAELATDIKQILSVKERREMLRAIAREKMDAVMQAGGSQSCF